MARHGQPERRLTTALAGSNQRLDSLRAHLRSQAVDVDHLEAENAEQCDVIKSLRADIARLQTSEQTDVQDLLHLAGRLLALSQATGVQLHTSTRALFRRRGWTATSRRAEA